MTMKRTENHEFKESFRGGGTSAGYESVKCDNHGQLLEILQYRREINSGIVSGDKNYKHNY